MDPAFVRGLCNRHHTEQSAFLRQLNALDGNTTAAIYGYYAMDTILRRGPKINPLLNRAPYFWKVTMNSLQSEYLLAITRILEAEHRSKLNLSKLIKIGKNNRGIFSKKALRERVRTRLRNDPDSIRNFMKRAVSLNKSMVDQLETALHRHDAVRDKLMKIRDKVIAHADLIETEEINELFQEITPLKIERLLAFLNQVHISLWSLFENGHSPRWKPKTLPKWRQSLADAVREDVDRFIDGLTQVTVRLT